MQVDATLWRETINESLPIWYVDCPTLPQCGLRRRVFLVLDTTDSCWPQSRDQVMTWLNRLANMLDTGDSCSLWLLGQDRPVLEDLILEGGNREQWRNTISDALDSVPTRAGSWLRDTIDGINICTGTGEADNSYLLLVTDGVIYDAGQVELPEYIDPSRILAVSPEGLPATLDGAWKKLHDERTLQDVLYLPSTDIKILLENEAGSHVYLCGAQNHRRVGDVVDVVDGVPGNRLGLCYMGGQEPRPVLVYSAGGEEGRIEFKWTTINEGHPDPRMHRIAELLAAPWDLDLLGRISKGDANNIKHCCGYQCDGSVNDLGSAVDAVCPDCGGSLLVGQKGFGVTVNDQFAVLLYPLSDGNPEQPEYRPATDIVGTGCYGIHTENDRQYLVLRFVPTSF